MITSVDGTVYSRSPTELTYKKGTFGNPYLIIEWAFDAPRDGDIVLLLATVNADVGKQAATVYTAGGAIAGTGYTILTPSRSDAVLASPVGKMRVQVKLD
jgi:hypothetical protein